MWHLWGLGVPGVPWHTQILADQLTQFQPGGTDYAHLIPTGTPGISDLPTALHFLQQSGSNSFNNSRLKVPDGRPPWADAFTSGGNFGTSSQMLVDMWEGNEKFFLFFLGNLNSKQMGLTTLFSL